MTEYKPSWVVIEQRKVTKNTVNLARTRQQKREANKRYQELNREGRRRCRRDKRVYVESEAKLRKLRRLEREVIRGLCTRSPES